MTPTVLTGVRSIISGIPNTFTHNKTLYTETWQVPFSGPPCYTIDQTSVRNITVSGLAALNGTYYGSLVGMDCPHLADPYPDECYYLVDPSVFCQWEFPEIPEISVDITLYTKLETFNNNTMMGTSTESTQMLTGVASFGWPVGGGAAGRILRISFTDPMPLGTGGIFGSSGQYGHTSGGASSFGFSPDTNAGVGDTDITPGGLPPIYEVMCDNHGDTGSASNASKNTTATTYSTPSSPTCAGLGNMNLRQETDVIDAYSISFTNETYV